MADADCEALSPGNLGDQLLMYTPQIAVNKSDCNAVDALEFERIKLLRYYVGIWTPKDLDGLACRRCRDYRGVGLGDWSIGADDRLVLCDPLVDLL